MTRSSKNRWKGLACFLLFLCLFLFTVVYTQCDPVLFWKRRSHITDLLSGMFPMDFAYIPHILTPLFYTIQMSVTGTVIGSVLACILAPACAGSMDFPKWIRYVLRFLIQILRSFPALILALCATFLFGLGTFAGTFAITLYTFAIMTRLTYQDMEAASPLAYQALRTMGVSRFPAYIHGLFPEIAPSFFTNALYMLETNVRHSSILGYVGAGGIGLLLNEKISWLEYEKVGSILLVLFLAVFIIENLSRYLAALIRKECTLKKKYIKLLLFLLTALFIVCTITLSPPDFGRTSLQTMKNMFSGFLSPDWSFFFSTKKDGLFTLHRFCSHCNWYGFLDSSFLCVYQTFCTWICCLYFQSVDYCHPIHSFSHLWTDFYPCIWPWTLYRSSYSFHVQYRPSYKTLYRSPGCHRFESLSRSAGYGSSSGTCYMPWYFATAKTNLHLHLPVSV